MYLTVFIMAIHHEIGTLDVRFAMDDFSLHTFRMYPVYVLSQHNSFA